MKELWNIQSLNVMHGKTSESLTLKKSAALLKNFCRRANQEKIGWPRWPSGKVSVSGQRIPGSKRYFTEDPPCMGPAAR
ncbi:hypothetical protein AVEN_254007-1 [Araneus ventricosus]|uniref:Uncharacterized protein n=1 Tax=Araneus ventricosus TaxID=182803 RepID=A0A4Y2E5T8_ARAVE|nr:hypothetical protein AVEN_254007-1 [Araneus ventricosus]